MTKSLLVTKPLKRELSAKHQINLLRPRHRKNENYDEEPENRRSLMLASAVAMISRRQRRSCLLFLMTKITVAMSSVSANLDSAKTQTSFMNYRGCKRKLPNVDRAVVTIQIRVGLEVRKHQQRRNDGRETVRYREPID